MLPPGFGGPTTPPRIPSAAPGMPGNRRP
jgi:hypothetical protein